MRLTLTTAQVVMLAQRLVGEPYRVGDMVELGSIVAGSLGNDLSAHTLGELFALVCVCNECGTWRPSYFFPDDGPSCACCIEADAFVAGLIFSEQDKTLLKEMCITV